MVALPCAGLRHTVEGKADEFETGVSKPYVKPRSCSTRTYPCDIIGSRHQRLLRVLCLDSRWLVFVCMSSVVLLRSELRKKQEYEGSQRELDEHMHTCREEWEMEVEVIGREHPLVVLPQVSVSFE